MPPGEAALAPEPVWGEFVAHEHLSLKNLTNFTVMIFALTPSFFIVARLYSCSASIEDTADPWAAIFEPSEWCRVAINRPVTFANLLFFTNVSVLFWLIGLLQQSFWLIDPYWTFIPPLLGHFYQLHPRATADPWRSSMALGLLWIWSFRLTTSYFRREDWKFGQREDWRYSKMAREHPRAWPILSFFAVGLAQQPMLVGISAPAFAVHSTDTPLGFADFFCAAGCCVGLLFATVADNQLRAYMVAKPHAPPILCTGLWRYSRHPNYFGEQVFWWSFAGMAVHLGQPVMLAGTAFNSLILAVVTLMTEERMLTGWTPPRAALYREYMRTTSPCIPWFPKRPREDGTAKRES